MHQVQVTDITKPEPSSQMLSKLSDTKQNLTKKRLILKFLLNTFT